MKSFLFASRQLFKKLEGIENPNHVNFIHRDTKHIHLPLFSFKPIILLIFSILFGTLAMAQKLNNDYWNSRHNLIRNWDFTTDLTEWGGWIDVSVPGQTQPVVANGIVSMTTGLANDGNNWHYQLNQKGLKAEANVPYTLKFKSWSSMAKSNGLDFEDSPGNGYNRYGASTDPESINGRSEWVYNTNTEPKWFTFHVVFDQMVPSTEQKIQWMLSTADATTYLDSIILFKVDTSSVNTTNLDLSVTNLNLADTEAIATVDITSNADWEARSSQSWLTATPLIGNGSQTLTISAKANLMLTPRTATITVYATRLDPQTITVTQNAKQQLPDDQIIVEHWNIDAWNSYNLIKSWNFTTDLTDWGGWIDGIITGQTAPVVTNEIVSMTTGLATDGNCWHYQFSQSGLKAEANVPYTLRFKSWSSSTRSNVVDFEDSPENGYNRYGVTYDAESIAGRSEWVYYTTQEPRWFAFHVVFDQLVPTTQQKIQWMLSTADATTYLDSIILIKDADLLLIKDANLVLSATQVSIAGTEANATVNLTSNTKCMAISDQDWLTVDPANSKGNQMITISVSANPLSENRTAKVTVFAAGAESKIITVTQESTTGIAPIISDQKLIIYPNPTSGKVKLVFDQIPPDGTYLAVTDLTGKTIVKQFIQNKEEWIDLGGNMPGIYFIKTNLRNVKVQKVLLR